MTACDSLSPWGWMTEGSSAHISPVLGERAQQVCERTDAPTAIGEDSEHVGAPKEQAGNRTGDRARVPVRIVQERCVRLGGTRGTKQQQADGPHHEQQAPANVACQQRNGWSAGATDFGTLPRVA